MEKRQIWPDWGNTTWADLAGLGSIGLCNKQKKPFAPSVGLSAYYVIYVHRGPSRIVNGPK